MNLDREEQAVVLKSDGYQSGAFPEAPGFRPFIEELSISETMVLQSIVAKVFSCPGRFGFSSGDEAAEAFLRYKARLRSIILKSREISGNKEAYIDSCLRFLARSVQRSQRKKEMLDIVLEISGDMGGQAFQSSLPSSQPQEPIDGETERFIANIAPSCFLARMNAEEKRLLYLVVKCAWEVDDSIAEKSARRLGLPVLWLCSLLHQARSSLEPSRLYLSRLNEKINSLWVRTRMIEALLREDNLRPERKAQLLRSSALCRARYESLLEKKSRCRLLVPNRIIAELLRIPKGSVDSGLFYLKANLRGKLEIR